MGGDPALYVVEEEYPLVGLVVDRSLGEDAQDVVRPGNNDHVSEGDRGLLGEVVGVEELELLDVTRVMVVQGSYLLVGRYSNLMITDTLFSPVT